MVNHPKAGGRRGALRQRRITPVEHRWETHPEARAVRRSAATAPSIGRRVGIYGASMRRVRSYGAPMRRGKCRESCWLGQVMSGAFVLFGGMMRNECAP